MTSVRVFFALLVAAIGCLATAGATSGANPPRVLAVEFENDVNPVTKDYVIGELERAGKDTYDAVVILLDTPGGLGSSMEDIYKAELASKVPVIVYVSPPGASATSAGVFIAQAADVLAMAPQTNIGSSTPIGQEGADLPDDLRRKAINEFAAKLRTLAASHGRNGTWADSAVRRASNLTANEALERNVVDVVAPDLPALLEQIDGVRTQPKGFVLHTAGAEIDTVSMSLWKRILDTIIDPNIIALLLSVGVLGIIVELWNPGLVFPGTVGGISLIVALFGLQVLPISWAGVLLLVLAFAFFAAEAFVASHGALTLAGAVSFVFGALMLFDPAGEAYQVSIWVALAVAGTLALLIGAAATKIVQARRARPQTGQEEMIGQLGVVRETLAPTGTVFVHGEIWRARVEGDPVPSGEIVRVDAISDGLVLEVSRVEETVAATA